LFAAPLALALLLAHPAPAQHLSADGAAQTFSTYTEQYFDDYFKLNPTAGTGAGFHQYDTQLEDYSAAGVQREVAMLHGWEKKLAAIDPRALDAVPAADYQILLNSIRAQLLQLEVVRPWEKNPDIYSSGPTGSIFSIMEREKLIPQVLLDARKNLKNPPRIYTEIALEQIEGSASFFATDVPSAFADADDPAAKAEFAKTNAAVVAALKSYGEWMKTDLLPRSSGDFRYGADTFAKSLSYDEMVDTPLDKLLAIGMADLHKNQAEFARVAKEIDPTKTPQEELAELALIHPAPDKLLQAFHDKFTSEIGFIKSHHIITLPSDVEPVLEETPPFMRATTQASMDAPGPFETHSTKAYFNVTLPEKDWSPERISEFMAAFNAGTIVSTSVHEAYPGHYVQFLFEPQYPSKIRKLIGANTNVEGWAHYCEQMMLDEGYGQPGNGAANERFVVGIRMHTGVGGAMTQAEAEKFFVDEGYQSRPIGEMETKRGTSDALYLYYTLGKLEILKLREDVKKKQGAAFNLQKFHDDLMSQGTVPIKIIRKAMLHDDSPVL
jgi:uncharacterized protein (DUF885 family)